MYAGRNRMDAVSKHDVRILHTRLRLDPPYKSLEAISSA